MSDGTESMFEAEPESSWNPLLAFSGGGSNGNGGDTVNLEPGPGNIVHVASSDAESRRAAAIEIGVKANTLAGGFRDAGQADAEKEEVRGLTSSKPAESRPSPTARAVPAATSSSMSDPVTNNRQALSGLSQRAQDYPPTNKVASEATSPLQKSLPKTPVMSSALPRSHVDGQRDFLRNLNCDIGLSRSGGGIGGLGFSAEGSSSTAIISDTQSFALPSASACTSGAQSEGVAAPGILPRPLPIDPQAAGLNGGVKKKKTVRARVGDLLPENIHCCPFEGCNKKFAKKYNLKIHVRRHAGDLPFQCDLPNCQKRFMWHSSFQRHQRSHLRKPIKGKRKKFVGAAENDAAPNSGARLDPSMIPSQLLTGNGTGPELPESILSALVNAGGGSPFDENSALHSAQLFCTAPALELAGPVYDSSALRPEHTHHRATQQTFNHATAQKPYRVDNNQLTINDYTSISAIESVAQNIKAAAKSNQAGGFGMHQRAPSHSQRSAPCGVESNSRHVSESMRMVSTQALPSFAHSAPGVQLFSVENDVSRLFSPISNADALGLNFLPAGLDENNGSTNLTNSEILPPSTFPETSSPTSGTSVQIAVKDGHESGSIPECNALPEQSRPAGTSPGHAELGVENFDESLAFLLDSIREPLRD